MALRGCCNVCCGNTNAKSSDAFFDCTGCSHRHDHDNDSKDMLVAMIIIFILLMGAVALHAIKII